MMRRLLLGLPFALAVGLIAALALLLFKPQQTPRAAVDFVVTASPLIGQPLPDWEFAALDAGPALRSGDLPALARGASPTAAPEARFLLLNFWASWCQPCVSEHPLLVSLGNAGLPLVGVAFKDAEADSQAFLARLGNPFLAVLTDPEGQGALQFGISGVPETYVIDGNGIIREHLRGELTLETIEARLLPLLQGAQGE